MSIKKTELLDTSNEKAARTAEKSNKEPENVVPEDSLSVEGRAPNEALINFMKTSFVRIGDEYYKRITTYDTSGRPIPALKKFNKDTLTFDFGKDAVYAIPKYDEKIVVPDHINFKPTIGKCVNMYNDVKLFPKEGSIETWDKLIHHIGGDQYDLLWDYIQLLYKDPLQVLPVLCLVSRKNQTGKSTFANALSYLFKENVGFFSQDDLTSPFNTFCLSLVAVFEEISDAKRSLNKIKAVSTAKKVTINAKYQQPYAVDVFTKILILTNNDEDFIKANKDDIRYWIRKIGTIDSFDSDFEVKLKNEVPAVVYFLQNRELSVPKKQSRMWFSPSQIKTEALEKVVKESRDDLQKDIELLLEDKLGEIGKDLYITSAMIKEWLGAYSTSYSKINAAMNALGYARKTGRYTDHLGFEKNQSHYHVPFVPIETTEEPNLPFDDQSVDDDEDNELPF